jgi:hypothetical protein
VYWDDATGATRGGLGALGALTSTAPPSHMGRQHTLMAIRAQHWPHPDPLSLGPQHTDQRRISTRQEEASRPTSSLISPGDTLRVPSTIAIHLWVLGRVLYRVIVMENFFGEMSRVAIDLPPLEVLVKLVASTSMFVTCDHVCQST